VNGTLANARFNAPSGLKADVSGNIYVADANNHCIRKITPNGIVSTIAGSGVAGSTDGNGTSASLNVPSNLAFDGDGNLLVAEFFGHVIRKITQNGDVSKLSGSTQGYINGTLASAKFRNPSDLVVVNDTIFVVDHGNHCIRMITPTGVVSTLAGTNSAGFTNGSGTVARFSRPTGIAYNPINQLLYVTDWDNHAIRTVTKQGVVATLSGDGTNGLIDGSISVARYNLPSGITIDLEGNLFIGDRGNHAIRKVSTDGNVSTIAGNGTLGNANGLLSDARFNEPAGLVLDINGADLLVTDQYNHRIRKIYRENPVMPFVEDRQIEGTGTITFTASNTLALNEIVEWSVDGTNWGYSASTFEQTLNAGQTITVYARVRNTVTGCTSTEVTATGTATTPTTRLQGNNPGLVVYPNPTTGILFLQTQSALPYTLTIYSTTGQLVHQTTDYVGNQTIDLSRQPKGVYFLNYQGTTGENTVERIILY
jgi:sugar lactone lactonase YvrE